MRGRQGMGGCGQSITTPLCSSFLTTLFTCSSVDSALATVHPEHIHLPWCWSSVGCMGYWLWHFTMGCRGVGEYMPRVWSTSSFDLGVSSAVPQSFCSLLFCLWGIVAGSSLTVFPSRCHYFGWRAQPCPAMVPFGARWSHVCLAQGSLSLSSPRPPHCQHIGMDIQYSPIQLKYFWR